MDSDGLNMGEMLSLHINCFKNSLIKLFHKLTIKTITKHFRTLNLMSGLKLLLKNHLSCSDHFRVGIRMPTLLHTLSWVNLC